MIIYIIIKMNWTSAGLSKIDFNHEAFKCNALINCKTHPTTPGKGASRVRHVLGKCDAAVRQSTAFVRQGS